MKTYLAQISLLAILFIAGCNAGTATHETLAAPDRSAEAIELSEEEAEVLESATTTPAEEAVPVTKENYEDALKQLEEEVDEEQ